jgi:hypothetical protein
MRHPEIPGTPPHEVQQPAVSGVERRAIIWLESGRRVVERFDLRRGQRFLLYSERRRAEGVPTKRINDSPHRNRIVLVALAYEGRSEKLGLELADAKTQTALRIGSARLVGIRRISRTGTRRAAAALRIARTFLIRVTRIVIAGARFADSTLAIAATGLCWLGGAPVDIARTWALRIGQTILPMIG